MAYNSTTGFEKQTKGYYLIFFEIVILGKDFISQFIEWEYTYANPFCALLNNKKLLPFVCFFI